MALKFFLHAPTVAFAARVNAPSGVDWPLDELQYDGVTTGAFADVLPGMTVLLGSAAGGSDLGISRIRKEADSDTIFVGRSSRGSFYGELDPVDNCYITVLNDYRVWPKIPYIDPDGVVYQDSDLTWAAYGQYDPPVANAGCGYAATIDSVTDLITVTFSAANSFTTYPGATITQYAWWLYDGTVTAGDVDEVSVTVTFPAGFRWVTLKIVDSNGATHYTNVPVLAVDPAADACVNNYTIERHTIRPDGQELSVRVRESIPASSYLDNTLCMLFDGEPSGPTDRSNIRFIGWAESEPADIVGSATATLRDVVLNCGDVATRLKTLPGFPQVLEHKDTPAKWGEMDTPDIGRFIHYILMWQSTALDLADFYLPPDGEDYVFTNLYSQGASLFEQASGRAQAMIPDHLLTCDRSGALRVLPDQQLMPTGDRTATVQTTLDAGDYTNLSYTQQRHPRAHWLRSDAFLVSSTETETLFSIAPGLTPGFGESAAEDRGHLARSQDELNITTGHRYARLNAPQSLFRITLANGNDLGIEPADLTWVNLTIPASVAAQRGLSFTAARGLVREMDIRYSSGPTGQVKTVTLQWEREVVGVTAVIEPVEPAEEVDDGDYNVPAVPAPAFNGGLGVGTGTVAFVERAGVIYNTSDFTATTPTWTRNTSAPATAGFGVSSVHSFVVDPFSPGYVGTGSEIRGYVAANDGIYRLNDIFGTQSYTLLHTYAQAIGSSNGQTRQIAASFGRYSSTVADNPWLMVVTSYRAGSGLNGVYIIYSRDAGATWSSEIQVSAFNNTAFANSPLRVSGIYLSPKTPGLAYVGTYTSTSTTATAAIYKSTDWGATWADATDLADDLGQGLGNTFHFPWQNNASETLMYHTKFVDNGSAFTYTLRRVVGGSSSDISPTVSGRTYAPYRGEFGLQSLDTNRLELVMAGIGDGVDDIDPGQSGSDALAGIFKSSDGGDTWTNIFTPVGTVVNDDFPVSVAFASGDPDTIYTWGNEFITLSTDGATFAANKNPTGGVANTRLIIGICGG